MKILVAGATGVIGRLLLPILVREGHEVIGMTRKESAKSIIMEMGASPLVVDALDREAVIAALREARPEVVIHHLTSLSNYNLEDNARIRTIGTRNLVDASQAVGVRRMIAQSISWTYEPGNHHAKEEESLDVEAPHPRKRTVDGSAVSGAGGRRNAGIRHSSIRSALRSRNLVRPQRADGREGAAQGTESDGRNNFLSTCRRCGIGSGRCAGMAERAGEHR